MELNYKILCQMEISFDNVIPSLSFYQILNLIYLLNMKIKKLKKLILFLIYFTWNTSHVVVYLWHSVML